MGNQLAGKAACVVFGILSIVPFSAHATEPNIITSNWRHRVNIDPVEDKKSCIVTAGTPDEKFPPSIIYVQGRSGGYLSVLGSQYPGEDIVFRVDKNKPVSGKQGLIGQPYEAIFEQIMDGGKTLMYKLINWPSGAPEYFQINLYGAQKHIEACLSETR